MNQAVVGIIFLCVLAVPGIAMTKYPDDAYSRPLDDHLPTFEMRACSPGEAIFERNAQFAVNEMTLVKRDGGWTTRWRIRSKGDSVASLSAECPMIRRAPRSLSFRVHNNSSKAISVKAQYAEYPWHPGSASQAVEWDLGEEEVEAGQERTVEFRFADAHWPDRATPEKPRYPGVMRLYVLGLEKDADYELFLNDYTFHYAQAADVRVTALKCALSEREVEFDLEADGRIAGRTIDLEVRREPWVIWRIRLNAAETAELSEGRCLVRTKLPFYLPAGRASVGLVADGYRVEGATASIRVENDRHPGLPKVERKLHNGRPTLFVNGKPFAWTGYQCTDFQPGNVGDFGRSGTRVLTIQCDLGRYCPQPGKYDYGSVDEQVATAFAANPNAMIFLAINLRLPPVWDQTHQDDLVRIATDSGTLVWEEGIGNKVGSLASGAWQRDQEIELRRLLRYCRSQPWADRLLGMWLMGEVTAEWFAWGSNDKQFADYSRPNLVQFGKAIPPPSVRNPSGYDLYRDAIAPGYNQYYADLTAETICRLARAAKDEMDGRTLVAVFYGYLIQLAGEFRGPVGGNFALKRVLDDPNVDVIGGVPLHNFRDFLNGYSVYISATESILAAGKLYCDSNDLFSWLHPLHWYREYDPTDPRNGSIQMQRRETANNAVHGAGNEWFSLMASWHHDTGLQADFARQNRVMEETLAYDRTPTEEIAFVVDESTFAWACPQSEYLRLTNTQLLFHCGRTGAPVGVWLLSDVDRLPDRIRFVVIACANAATPESIARLDRLIRKGSRTILVVGAPGLINPVRGVWYPEAVEDLLGLPVRVEDAVMPAGMVLSSDGSAVTTTDEKVRPRAFLEGEGILRYTDGKCAGAERSLPNGGRLIWCGIPPHSTALIRRWAYEAGVHFYAPQEYSVYSSKELVSVTSPKAGEVTLTWPKDASIRDLFDGWRGSGREIACPFDAGRTRLFAVVFRDFRAPERTQIPKHQ